MVYVHKKKTVFARDGCSSAPHRWAADRADGAPQQLGAEGSTGRAASPGAEGEGAGSGDGAAVRRRAPREAPAQPTARESSCANAPGCNRMWKSYQWGMLQASWCFSCRFLQYEEFLDQLSETMKVDSIAVDLGSDMRMKVVLTRAEQMVQQETASLMESKCLSYSLQRKVGRRCAVSLSHFRCCLTVTSLLHNS